MIRRIYIDLFRSKLYRGDVRWVLSRGAQYLLTHASALVRKPLCGPILGTVVTNYTCTYRCRMCDLPQRDRELRDRGLREFTTGQMMRLLRDFAAMGTPGIGFTGGEPLLRPDLFDLLASVKTLGMFSHLNTNGYLLDGRNSGRIIEARVDSLNISLDGAGPATHDVIRGHAGAFARTVSGIERIIDARSRAGSSLRIKTVTVLQEENIHEVGDLVRLAERLGVDCVEFIPVQRFTAGAGTAQSAEPSLLARVDAVARELLEWRGRSVRLENSPAHLRLFGRSFRGEASPLRCFAGYNSCVVDCYGEIYPCVPWVNWRRSVGSVREVGLQQQWRSSRYAEVRRDIASCRKCYLNCQAELNILFNPGGRPGMR